MLRSASKLLSLITNSITPAYHPTDPCTELGTVLRAGAMARRRLSKLVTPNMCCLRAEDSIFENFDGIPIRYPARYGTICYTNGLF